MLPESLVSPLQDHLRIVKRTHEEDLAKGYGAVRFACPTPWNANTPTRSESGSGSTSFLPIGFQ